MSPQQDMALKCVPKEARGKTTTRDLRCVPQKGKEPSVWPRGLDVFKRSLGERAGWGPKPPQGSSPLKRGRPAAGPPSTVVL